MDLHSILKIDNSFATEINEKLLKGYVENILDDLRLAKTTLKFEYEMNNDSNDIFLKEIAYTTEDILDQLSTKSLSDFTSIPGTGNPEAYERHLLSVINKFEVYINWANNLIKLINSLQKTERSFIIQFYFKEVSFEQVAKRLNTSTRVLYRVRNNALLELGLSIPTAVAYALKNDK